MIFMFEIDDQTLPMLTFFRNVGTHPSTHPSTLQKNNACCFCRVLLFRYMIYIIYTIWYIIPIQLGSIIPNIPQMTRVFAHWGFAKFVIVKSLTTWIWEDTRPSHWAIAHKAAATFFRGFLDAHILHFQLHGIHAWLWLTISLKKLNT